MQRDRVLNNNVDSMPQVFNNLKNNFCDFLGKIIITRQDDQRRSLIDERWLHKLPSQAVSWLEKFVRLACTQTRSIETKKNIYEPNSISRRPTCLSKTVYLLTYLLKSAQGRSNIKHNWTKFTDFNYHHSPPKTPMCY